MTEHFSEDVYIATEGDDDAEVQAALERSTADGSGLEPGEEPPASDYVAEDGLSE